MYNMDHFNLLDLDDDVLNIMGRYVKKDNIETVQKEKKWLLLSKIWILNYVDSKVKEIKR